jgi:putative component of toxin-antitoxin plasmid stabilization module
MCVTGLAELRVGHGNGQVEYIRQRACVSSLFR